jgi:hypothetical protein
MTPVSYPRRQRNRRLARSLEYATVAFIALLLAAAGFSAGLRGISVPLVVAGVVSTWLSRHWLRLARRSNVGARSEQRVRAQLERLAREGWRIRHSLRWQGGGDVDHIAIAPPAIGVAFAIETKTRTHGPDDLARITAVALWLSKRRFGRCRHGALPILCLAGTRGIERWEAGVAVVSADRLVPVLSRLAGTTPKPGFLR